MALPNIKKGDMLAIELVVAGMAIATAAIWGYTAVTGQPAFRAIGAGWRGYNAGGAGNVVVPQFN